MKTDPEMAAKIAQWEREAREPSPLPWSCKPHDSYMRDDEEEPIEIVDANGDTVADNVSYYAHHIKVADARFIVQRVNAHDALVAALEEIGRKAGDATTFYESGVNSSAMFSDISTLVDAALAMARKGG